MKRLFAMLLLLLMLAGCADRPEAETDPVWQAELSGGTLTISGCTVTETQAELCQTADPSGMTLPLLMIEGVPSLTLTGMDEADIALAYIEPVGESWQLYEPYIPVEKLDYILTRETDGTLVYRLDTVYGYCLTVGDKQWLLDVHHDGY